MELARCFSALQDDFSRADAWAVVSGWETVRSWRREGLIPQAPKTCERVHLLDGGDLVWIYDMCSRADEAGDERHAEVLAQLAAWVFNPNHSDAAEFVFDRQQHPAWPFVRSWFDPVPLDGEYAKLMRRSATREREPTGATPDEVRATLSQLRELLAKAVSGDTDAFWRLLWNLQFDPTTREGRTFPGDDLRDFPGTRALEPAPVEELARACVTFLESEHDHRAEWLGTDKYDRRGLAGYLALAFLMRRDELDQVHNPWDRWLGACLWFPVFAGEGGGPAIKSCLLQNCADKAGANLAGALLDYVRGELARGQGASALEQVPFARSSELFAAGVLLLKEIWEAWGLAVAESGEGEESVTEASAAVANRVILRKEEQARNVALFAWDRLVAALLLADSGHVSEVLAALRVSATESQIALLARATAILVQRSSRAWAELALTGSTDEEGDLFLRDVVLNVARGYHDGLLLSALNESQLAASFELLFRLFPPEGDWVESGAHMVGPEEQARRMRDDVLAHLSERGSEESVRELAALAVRHAGRPQIQALLLRSKTLMFATAWSPPEPDDLARMFADAARRLVRSEEELAALLIETLMAVENDVAGHCELLWDRLPKRFLADAAGDQWIPKPEAAMCAYFAHELTMRLDRRGLAVNREVLVLPRDAYGAGDRTDLLVEATVRDDEVLGIVAGRLAVVVEVKGAWNRELLTSQLTQLADRYLPEASSETGIYLVGWFPPSLWSELDRRRVDANRLVPEGLDAKLLEQAHEIKTSHSLSIHPLRVNLPRPVPAP